MVARMLRGMAGTALLWSAFGIPATVATWLAIALTGSELPSREMTGVMLASATLRWALSGGVFAAGVAVMGRRPPAARLSLARMAGLGVAAACFVPALTFVLGVVLGGRAVPLAAWVSGVVISVVVGAAAGAGTQWLAWRGAPRLSGADVPPPRAA